MNSNVKEIEELSDGWVRCRSKSNPGRQYFFNRKTGKSSWTQPQPGEKQAKKSKKKQSPKRSQQNKQQEGAHGKSVKRKSGECEAESSKKKLKKETPVKKNQHNKKISPKQIVTRAKSNNKTKSPAKRTSHTEASSKHLLSNNSKQITPIKNVDSPSKVTPSKNLASKRLSELRAQLNNEAEHEVDNESSTKRTKTGPIPDINETHVKPRTELPSPNVSESTASITTKSPSSDSLHFIPSPSQFFAANKIICSMKAQLSEEYCNKEKPKDTFADIEQGICSQMTEYPIIKHPSTPPQFSEASKLVSAIKSRLSYTPKEIKIFSSAKNRMESLRASISGEIDEGDLQDISKNDSFIIETTHSFIPQVSHTPEKCEAMEVEDIIKESIEVSYLDG